MASRAAHRRPRYFGPALLCLALTASSAGAAMLGKPLEYRVIPGASPVAKARINLDDPSEVKQFVDAEMRDESARATLAGAAVAVVSGGRVLMTSGYGKANADTGQRALPTTLFRLGSVSKVVTWTAIMQLVDQHRLDLDEDVNAYLDRFRIPAKSGQPVTLRHLMTHTAGFEQLTAGIMAARSPESAVSLADNLARHSVPLVLAPLSDFGRLEGHAYSNWGAMLAGRIVEIASGQPFETYVKEHIFQPLGMTRSTFRDMTPGDLANDVAVGHIGRVSGGKREKIVQPLEYYAPSAPSAGLSSTADDMARFMIAHLHNGRYADREILSKDSAVQMHQRVYGPSPYVGGFSLGFIERYINGHRVLWHGGATLRFYTEMYLLPDDDVGVFVTYNTLLPANVSLMRSFMDHYFPAELPPLTPKPDMAAVLERFQGFYRYAMPSETWQKAVLLANPGALVVRQSAGALIAGQSSGGGADEALWLPVPGVPTVVRRARHDDMMAFVEGASGETFLLKDSYAPLVKVPWYETPDVITGSMMWFERLFVLSFLLASAALAWSVFSKRPAIDRAAGAQCAGVAALNLAVLWALQSARTVDPYTLLVEVPQPYLNAMRFGIASLILTLGLCALAALAWRRGWWSVAARAACTCCALAGVTFLIWLHHWNLLGYAVP